MVAKQLFHLFTQKYRPYSVPFLMTALLALFIYSSHLHADTVTASLNKTVITENEIIQLTLRADFSDTGTGPDLTPLERDFKVLGKSQNSQFSFNLGTSKALSFWVVSLMPKSVGTVEIPPIKIGDHQSQAIRLSVRNSPQLLDQNGNPPVIMKADVSEIEPYLQQEVIITVELYTSVALQNANRSSPSHPELIVERLIDDQVRQQTINGTQYQVFTREYLAFPQRSGKLTVPPQSIQAMINTSDGRRLIKVQSEPINLQVLPIPASYTSDVWLPSSNVIASTSLEQSSDSTRIGDTLIWTINIQAHGALPEQIPTLDFNSTRNYKLYPQPPKFNTRKTSRGVIGQQTITVEVVPTEEGMLSLPDIDITYWNTETRRLNNSSTPTEGIMIKALSGSEVIQNNNKTSYAQPNNEPLPAQPKSVAPISLLKQPTESTESSALTNNVDNTGNQTTTSMSLRDYIITGLFAFTLLMLLLCAVIWLKRKKETEAAVEVPTLQEFAPLDTQDEKSAFNALIQSCMNSDLMTLRPCLLEWARHRWGDNEIESVDDIKRLTSVQVTQLLMEAELMLYSKNPDHSWQGTPLAEALEEYTSGHEKPSQESKLKSLYPNF